MYRGEGRSSNLSSLDDPPNSRLFIIGSQSLGEDDYREAFENFGMIEEIWTVKDKHTGENKGITYIKFSKTSEAARAMEALHGKRIRNSSKNLKIMISANRGQVPKREWNEEEKTLRLFVVVPKTMSDGELFDYFKQWGEIDYATILRDKETRENKGFAYVKYYKFSHAAEAFEECDRKYKPVFAEPRKPSMRGEEKSLLAWDSSSKLNSTNASSSYQAYGSVGGDSNDRIGGNSSGGGYGPPSTTPFPVPPMTTAGPSNGGQTTTLTAIVSPTVNQDQLWRLFDIVPGLDYCHLNKDMGRSVATVVYNSAHWATHAKEKIHGLEYPPGSRIIVKFENGSVGSGLTGDGFHLKPEIKPGSVDIMQIAESIAYAAGITTGELQARLGVATTSRPQSDLRCSVQLPETQPMVGDEEEATARCFIVCTPHSLPQSVLRDIFCRFGNLIDAYLLNNKNCGFAKYTSKESADHAMRTLHGAVVNGVKLKVLEAEERQQDHNRKRQRLEDN